MEKKAVLIKVRGLVQGVGFRPFVYRIAHRHGIEGWVENNNEGVTIHAEGNSHMLDSFMQSLKNEAPKASSVSKIDAIATEVEGLEEFTIRRSADLSDEITQVSPDIAVCDDCLRDMQEQAHRCDYLFTNCTHCGPRFTIIQNLPYDRHQTTMAPFVMCEQCRSEYTNILDRRFHAQPVACLQCGPHYFLLHPKPETDIRNFPLFAAEQVDEGKILAIKGLGGYHLICNAHNSAAVLELRRRKQREAKPMAVMMRDVETMRKYFVISDKEEELLHSWQRPIVLVQNMTGLAEPVSNDLHTTGLILPYMPFHHYLFKFLKTDALVFTSANVSDEPVVMDEETASKQLADIADFIIAYNRDIHNRADDSVAMVAHKIPMLIRRSRGYAPGPVELRFEVEGILATGAELNNTFAIGKGRQAILSQHIGDLKNAPTLAFFEQSLERYQQLFRFKARQVACDLHPDYLSTQFARQTGLLLVEVQHHHAHMASCMAEHGLIEPVIGIIFDGTGLGTDGTIWGGECLVGDYAGFQRISHLDPVPLPGGDAVTHQPWRTAFAYLWKYYGNDRAMSFAQSHGWCDDQTAQNLLIMLGQNLNSPLSSGAGRLFDAVAALTGLCIRAGFHAEAPMRLEAAVSPDHGGHYDFGFQNRIVSLRPMFDGLLADLEEGLSTRVIAARFHNTVVRVIEAMAQNATQVSGIKKVVLSGGSFQNRILVERSVDVLQSAGYEVYIQQKVPCNDGGIALGQLAVAAAKSRRP